MRMGYSLYKHTVFETGRLGKVGLIQPNDNVGIIEFDCWRRFWIVAEGDNDITFPGKQHH